MVKVSEGYFAPPQGRGQGLEGTGTWPSKMKARDWYLQLMGTFNFLVIEVTRTIKILNIIDSEIATLGETPCLQNGQSNIVYWLA